MSSEQLLWAVKNGDLQTIKDSLENVCHNRFYITYQITLIHYAADYGQKEICAYLIKNGADISDNFGVTPLLAAIYEGHVDCVSLLLNNGAKLGVAPDGSTYVDCAASEDIRNILRNHIVV
ncbi:unnamed protein product [Trichobilharzia regenti]|nr:unnamed protein product [Trichobilharzia regenti]